MIENIIRLAVDYPFMTLASLMPLFIILMVWFGKIKLDDNLNLVIWFSAFFFLSDLPLWITTGLGIHNLKYYYLRELSNHLIIIGIYYVVITSAIKKKVILFTMVLLATIGITSLLFSDEAPGQLTSIYKIGVILVVFMHFHAIISELKVKNILAYPFFWISSGMLIFSCGSILIFLFYTFTFRTTPAFFLLYMRFLDILVILMFVFIGVGLKTADKKYA